MQMRSKRVANRHDLVLFTDGEPSYATLFPEYFGVPYQPVRNGTNGRRPKIRYRIPRSLAHVQIVKRPGRCSTGRGRDTLSPMVHTNELSRR